MGKKKKGGKKANHKRIEAYAKLLIGIAALVTAVAQLIIVLGGK